MQLGEKLPLTAVLAVPGEILTIWENKVVT
jgi:hypothetical protein